MRRDVFQAIADPVRRDIIGLLAHQNLNVNAIADNFEISRPAISRHLKILQECGLVDIKEQGRERHCAFRPDNLIEVADWLSTFSAFWETSFNQLDDVLAQMKQSKDKEADNE